MRIDRRKRQQRKRRCLITQKILGGIMLAISAAVPVVNGGDVTPCLVTVPLGLALLFSKNLIITICKESKKNMTEYEKTKVRDLINGMSAEELKIAKEEIEKKCGATVLAGK